VKQLETAKKRLQVRFEKRANREMKDNTVTFEDLGISELSKAFDNSEYAQQRFMRRTTRFTLSPAFLLGFSCA
jgi:hypothetical protein